MRKFAKIKKGFTIAELTVAMLLIAGIAMILMPTLIANNENQILMTSLDKMNTDLQQTFQAMPLLQAQGKIGINQNNMAASFMEAIRVSHKVISGQNSKFNQYIYTASPTGMAGTAYTDYISGGNNIANGNTIILKNTMFITYLDQITIIVDVNGRKGPNKTGRDIFFFRFRTIPVGLPNAGEMEFGNFYDAANNPIETCTIGGNFKNSAGCAAKYLRAGKMSN